MTIRISDAMIVSIRLKPAAERCEDRRLPPASHFHTHE
jgi:hypothetical protein